MNGGEVPKPPGGLPTYIIGGGIIPWIVLVCRSVCPIGKVGLPGGLVTGAPCGTGGGAMEVPGGYAILEAVLAGMYMPYGIGAPLSIEGLFFFFGKTKAFALGLNEKGFALGFSFPCS